MNVTVQKDFERDIKFIQDKKLAASLKQIIQRLKECESLSDVPNVKRMKGHSQYFRIRTDDYRMWPRLTQNTIILLRFMHRKDIYRYFP